MTRTNFVRRHLRLNPSTMQNFLNRWMPLASGPQGWGVPLAAVTFAALFLISLMFIDAMDSVRLQPSRSADAKLYPAASAPACYFKSLPVHFSIRDLEKSI